MSSVEDLREFISDRLSAAAAEIFTVFLQTISQYEEEIQAQQKQLQIIRRGTTKSPKTDDLQQQFYRDEQLWNEEENSRLSQEKAEPPSIEEGDEEPEPPPIKEVLLVVKQEANTTLRTVSDDESEHRDNLVSGNLVRQFVNEKIHAQESLLNINLNSKMKLHKIDGPKQKIKFSLDHEEPKTPLIKEEKEEVCISPGSEQLELKQDVDFLMRIPAGEPSEPEPYDELLLCHDSVAGGQNQTNVQHSGSNGTANLNFNSPFPQQSFFSVNMSAHSIEKPYSCGRCGKIFSYESMLLAHMTTHTDEKSYSCETCGKSFKKKCVLLIHKRTHTGEKPYSCEVCGKSYRQANGLLYHSRTHTGEKPYSCTTCGKGFSRNRTLLVHMRIHTNKKLYACETW